MRVLVAAIALSAACSPDIGTGTYFCGPDRLCPPDLECDDNTFVCESRQGADRFECPAGSESSEPDDSRGDALEAGPIACGAPLFPQVVTGCVADAEDRDHIAFELEQECTGEDPHVEITLRYPIALVALEMSLLDEDGDVVADGEICTLSGDATGMERVCIDRPLDPGAYVLRIRSTGVGDCDGDCPHNQYVLDISYPLA